ncbi:nicotinate (nicotinamide) nucleotide adenylyltransferase [Ferruginibacter sp. SUN002]|uniref:nicotinate (nicotinamide) nucleotide adenylyltransferase n=1 Tax=Ferruginibacter sp. SUN002 TaxID=2937789 RepID=UPI003D35B37B
MKIGLYFGSFNPVHTGHLIIANHIAHNFDLQQVWMVVSPQNPFKKSVSLLNEYHRLHFIQASIEGETKLKASNVEFKLPKPSYTIDTLTYLEEKYPEHQFSIIMGSDSFNNLSKWKNYELIVKKYKLFIYIRPGFEVDNSIGATIEIVKAPLLEISSTHIRELVKEGKSIRYLVPDVVNEEIERNGYYRQPV